MDENDDNDYDYEPMYVRCAGCGGMMDTESEGNNAVCTSPGVWMHRGCQHDEEDAPNGG